MTDLILTNHGTLVTLKPVSDEGKQWLEDNVDTSEVMWWCGGLVIEPRYVDSIIAGAESDGLLVE